MRSRSRVSRGSSFRGSSFRRGNSRVSRPSSRRTTRASSQPSRGSQSRFRNGPSTRQRTRPTNSARNSRSIPNARSQSQRSRRQSPIFQNRTRGTSTRDYINRRYSSTRRGARGNNQTRNGFTRHDRPVNVSSRPNNGDRKKRSHAGWRQPTIGQGYAERFPGTSRIPVRNHDGSYSLNGRSYYKGSYRHGKHGYRGFYHQRPVCVAYVPYGFYGGGTSTYISETYIREDYPVERYEEERDGVESEEYAREEPVQAAATSAAAERYLREATELFGDKNYPEAARRFRLAAIAAPENAAPLFALGISLIPLENYPYAAKVIRRAIDLDPSLLDEGGDVSAVFKDLPEFARVKKLLTDRIATRPDDIHAPFLLGALQYFSGDPEASATFKSLAERDESDRIAIMFSIAAHRRFKAAEDLPPIR